MNNFSEYIVYVDESGDHGMGKAIDKNFPVFVLAFCIFNKEYYSAQVVSNIKKFKFKYFGHDIVTLHEREIRKDEGCFSILRTKDLKEKFIGDLTNIISISNFEIISTLVRKENAPDSLKNPYKIAMKNCLADLYKFIIEKKGSNKLLYIVFEKRGTKEDTDLELEFRRLKQKNNYPFEILFADKKVNSAGLQFADMVARPIGIKSLKPEQVNRAYEIIKTKLYAEREV